MTIDLPATFSYRVNNIVRCLDQYEAATSTAEREQLMREAVAISCALLSELNVDRLGESLYALLRDPGDEQRKNALEILRRNDLFALFEILEGHVLDRAGFTFPARERILALLGQLREQAVNTLDTVEPKDLTNSMVELRQWVCEWKERWIKAAQETQERNETNEAHTRLVNTLGTVSIVVNAAVYFAGAASIMFLPVISVAACVASITLGGVAQKLKARKVTPVPPVKPSETGIQLKVSRPRDNRYKLR